MPASLAPVSASSSAARTARDLGMIGIFRRHAAQQLFRLGEILALDRGAHQAGDRVDIAGLVLQHLGEDVGRARVIARRRRFLGERHRLGDGVGAGRRAGGELADELLDLALADRADEGVDRPPVLEGIDRGDRLDAHLRREFLVLVDIDLDEADLAARVAHRLFEDRAQLLARPAPRRPEIDDDGGIARGVDDVGHEGRGRAVLDEIGAVRGLARRRR